MAKYRKNPIVIEAFRMGMEDRPDWFQDEVTKNKITTHLVEDEIDDNNPFEFKKTYCLIKTLEGIMRGEYGDWIIKEPFPINDRKFYPCKPDIFEKTYELVED